VSNLTDALRAALNAARKAQQKDRTLVLGTILANVKNRELELGRDPTDDEVVEVLRRESRSAVKHTINTARRSAPISQRWS